MRGSLLKKQIVWFAAIVGLAGLTACERSHRHQGPEITTPYAAVPRTITTRKIFRDSESALASVFIKDKITSRVFRDLLTHSHEC